MENYSGDWLVREHHMVYLKKFFEKKFFKSPYEILIICLRMISRVSRIFRINEIIDNCFRSLHFLGIIFLIASHSIQTCVHLYSSMDLSVVLISTLSSITHTLSWRSSRRILPYALVSTRRHRSHRLL